MALLCPWTEPFWFGLNISRVPSVLGPTTFHGWLVEAMESIHQNNPTYDANISLIFYAIWNIWKYRNKVVFNDKKRFPMGAMIITQS